MPFSCIWSIELIFDISDASFVDIYPYSLSYSGHVSCLGSSLSVPYSIAYGILCQSSKFQVQNELGHGFFFVGVEQSSIFLAVTVQHSFNASGPGWGIR